VPKFLRILREPGLSGHIWCVTTPGVAWVSQSMPSIVRAMAKFGDRRWASCFYRKRAKFRCRTADELNRALLGYNAAMFIIRDPDCWEIDATADLGDDNNEDGE